MSIFCPRRPRAFHHEYIYVNERKERMVRMEEQARNELAAEQGMNKGFNSENLRGTFVQATRHLRRQKARKDKRQTKGMRAMIVAIVMLILIWIYLL